MPHSFPLQDPIPMASFTRVPDEVWVTILSNFERKQDQATINALRLTNMKFNILVEPLIYHIAIDNIGQPLRSPDDKIEQLQQWAWRIAVQPKYAKFLKEIDLKEYDHIGKNNPIPVSKTKPLLLNESYGGVVNELNLPTELKAALLTDLEMETSAAHLAFLLATCTELEVLKIPQAFDICGKLVRTVIKHATTLPHGQGPRVQSPLRARSAILAPMSCVRDVSLGNFIYQTGVIDALTLLSLPSLTNLNIYGLADTRDHWVHDLPQTGNTILNKNKLSLTFDSCMLSGEGLSEILSSCLSLQSLVVRWRPGLWNEHLDNADIGKALRASGTTLEDLQLDTTDVYRNRWSSDEPPPFGSFVGLVNLHTLAVPSYAFPEGKVSATDILPKSLRKLFVLGMEKEEAAAYEGVEWAVDSVTIVGWHHYSIAEWFGNVPHKCVNYNSVEGLKLESLTTD